MLMEKPQCNFKNCRYCFDGNCFSADKYENCELTDLHCEIAKLRVDLDNAKTEVAREIFELIEKYFYNNEYKTGVLTYCNFFNIKKKYLEDKT